MVLRLDTFDWNRPQHIRPRCTTDEVERAVSLLRQRLGTLERDNASLAAPLLACTDKETRP